MYVHTRVNVNVYRYVYTQIAIYTGSGIAPEGHMCTASVTNDINTIAVIVASSIAYIRLWIEFQAMTMIKQRSINDP